MSEKQDRPSDSGGRGQRGRTIKLVVITAFVAALVAVGLVALLVNIFERKQEARNPFYRVVEITDETEDPAVWGKNFPLQYDGYLRTVDQQRTRYGGSEAVPRTPTQADPRSVVAQSSAVPVLRPRHPSYGLLSASRSFPISFRTRPTSAP